MYNTLIKYKRLIYLIFIMSLVNLSLSSAMIINWLLVFFALLLIAKTIAVSKYFEKTLKNNDSLHSLFIVYKPVRTMFFGPLPPIYALKDKSLIPINDSNKISIILSHEEILKIQNSEEEMTRIKDDEFVVEKLNSKI